MNTPAQIAANYVAIGKGKANLPLVKMLLLAILAGAFIALAGAAATFGNVYVNKAMGAAIFPQVDSVWSLVLLCVAPLNLIKGAMISILTILLYKKVAHPLFGRSA